MYPLYNQNQEYLQGAMYQLADLRLLYIFVFSAIVILWRWDLEY
jgi:hypothetical protein